MPKLFLNGRPIEVMSVISLSDVRASTLFDGLPRSLPNPCRGLGNGKWELLGRSPSCVEHRVAANGPQGRFAPLTRWPPAILDRRSPPRARECRSGRRDGLFGRTQGCERQGELADFRHFSSTIIYRESVIALRQFSCHFSLPTVLGAHNEGVRSGHPFGFAAEIFFCAPSMMRTNQETSKIVIEKWGDSPQIPSAVSASVAEGLSTIHHRARLLL